MKNIIIISHDSRCFYAGVILRLGLQSIDHKTEEELPTNIFTDDNSSIDEEIKKHGNNDTTFYIVSNKPYEGKENTHVFVINEDNNNHLFSVIDFLKSEQENIFSKPSLLKFYLDNGGFILEEAKYMITFGCHPFDYYCEFYGTIECHDSVKSMVRYKKDDFDKHVLKMFFYDKDDKYISLIKQLKECYDFIEKDKKHAKVAIIGEDNAETKKVFRFFEEFCCLYSTFVEKKPRIKIYSNSDNIPKDINYKFHV